MGDLYDKVTHLVDQGKPVDVVVLDFSKAFDTHSTLLDKTSSILARQVHNMLGEQLVDGSGFKRYSKCGYLRLAASHQQAQF